MEWYQELYIGESIRNKKEKIKSKILHNRLQAHVYVISLSFSEKDILDIIPARELLQKYYPKEKLYIVGLAGNYKEAVSLSGMIVSEVYQMTGGFDVKGYIRQRG